MTKTKPDAATPYDAADYLTTPGRIAAYLTEAAETREPALIAAAIGAVLRAQNQSQIARETGISRDGLRKAFSANGNPSLETLISTLESVGVRLAFEAA